MEERTSFYITLLYKDFLAYVEKTLKKMGLDYEQLPFILYVGKHPGCTTSELRKETHLEWKHSKKSLSNLKTDGFIVNKGQHLFLTMLGEEAYKTMHHVCYYWDQELQNVMEPEEWNQAKKILKKLVLKRGEH